MGLAPGFGRGVPAYFQGPEEGKDQQTILVIYKFVKKNNKSIS